MALLHPVAVKKCPNLSSRLMTEACVSLGHHSQSRPREKTGVSHQVGVIVAFVYLMGDDVPTSAAVSARDSEHSRRRVRLRHHLLPEHTRVRMCLFPAISSHSAQTSMRAFESLVQIASRSQHSHGKVWSLAIWANTNRPSTSTCSPLTSLVAFFSISVWFIVVLNLFSYKKFVYSIYFHYEKIFM